MKNIKSCTPVNLLDQLREKVGKMARTLHSSINTLVALTKLQIRRQLKNTEVSSTTIRRHGGDRQHKT